jgi:HSP20 family protein
MTTVTRWEPFRGLATLHEQMNRLFDERLFRGRPDDSVLTNWAPAVDIYETPDELVVKAEVPDIDPDDIDIGVENNVLTIRGERKLDNSVSEDNYLRVERAYGTFTRSFALSKTLDAESIKAEYRDGVLTLRAPKWEEAKPKQIKVNVRSNGGK